MKINVLLWHSLSLELNPIEKMKWIEKICYKNHSMNKRNFQEKAKYFFFHKCKLYIIWNWFIVKNYFNLTKLFLLRLFKMVANQTEWSRLEKRSVIKFLVAEKCIDFLQKMCNYKHCFHLLRQNSLYLLNDPRIRARKATNL